MRKADRVKFKALISKVSERLQIPVLEAIQPVKKKKHSEFIKVLAQTSFFMGTMLAISPLLVNLPYPIMLFSFIAAGAAYLNYRAWSKYNDMVCYEKFVMNLNYGVSEELVDFRLNNEHRLTPEELQELFSLNATSQEIKNIFNAINDHHIFNYNDMLYVNDDGFEEMLCYYPEDSETHESIHIKTGLINYSKNLMANIDENNVSSSTNKHVQYFNAKKHL